MTMTSNPPSVVDEDRFVVRRSIDIAAPVEKVWAAVTEPDHISKWFGQASFHGTEAGATGTLSWPDYGAVPVRVEAMDPPKSVSYRWSNYRLDGTPPEQVDPDHSTVFTFTLEPTASGTRLTVVETGFQTTPDPLATLESHRQGWDSELDELVELLEGAA